jgi:hypothetical protein
MAKSLEVRRRIDEFARQLAEELGDVSDSEGDCWLDAIENRAVELGDAISVALIEQQAARQPALVDEAACPQCGQAGDYQGERPRELLTRRGPIKIAEREYFCPCCRKAFFPADHSDRR